MPATADEQPAKKQKLGDFKLPSIDPAFDAWLAAQLDASPADDKDTDDFKYLTFSEPPPFTDGHKSLMRKTMTPELFAKLKDVKSSKGYTLSNGMQAGVLRPHLGVGFTCGDEECFELFKDVIDPIVKGWHGFDPSKETHQSNLDFDSLSFSDEQQKLFTAYVKSTRVRAARNISGFSLPAGSSKGDRLVAEAVLIEAFDKLPDNLQLYRARLCRGVCVGDMDRLRRDLASFSCPWPCLPHHYHLAPKAFRRLATSGPRAASSSRACCFTYQRHRRPPCWRPSRPQQPRAPFPLRGTTESRQKYETVVGSRPRPPS